MGKKRRYIHRARKFAQKYFKILDGFDGADDSEIQKYAAFIDTLVATDLGNQTVRLTGRVLGYASAVTDDGIEYSLDGADFVAVDSAISDNSSGDIDEFTFDSGTGAAAIGISATGLSVGTHTVIVRPKGDADKQRQKEVSFKIEKSRISLGGIAAAFQDTTSDNISFDASALTISGKTRAGINTDAALGDASTNKIKIEILRDGAVQKLTGNVDSITHNIGVDFADNGGASPINDAHILHQDLTGVAASTVVTYEVVLTPFDVNDVALDPTVAAITVTKAE